MSAEFEHKLKIVLEPDTRLIKKALEELRREAGKVTETATGTAHEEKSEKEEASDGVKGGKPFREETPKDIGQQMADSFINVLRGRQSPLTAISQALRETPWAAGVRGRIFGTTTIVPPTPPPPGLIGRAGAWLGRGVGSIGPGSGALLGGTAAAAGGAMLIGAAFKAAQQFVEGVRLYVQASARLTDAILHANPTQLLLAATTAQQASIRVNMWKGVATGAAGGAAMGGLIGGAATGGPGATIGALVGGGLGATGGVIVGSVKAWIKGIELQIQERLFSMLDGLVSALDNYNSAVFGAARYFELKQHMFMYDLGRAVSPVLTAWIQLKVQVLDYLLRIMPSLQPVFDAIIAYLHQIGQQLPQIVAGMLNAFADAIDALEAFKQTLIGLRDWVKTNFPMTLGLAKGAVGVMGGNPDPMRDWNRKYLPFTTSILDLLYASGKALSGQGKFGDIWKSIINEPWEGSPYNPLKKTVDADSAGFIGPPTREQAAKGGFMGSLSDALRKAAAGVLGMPVPDPNKPVWSEQDWSHFSARFAYSAFGNNDRIMQSTRPQAGYGFGPGQVGAPTSGAQRARDRLIKPQTVNQATAQQTQTAPSAAMPKFIQNISLEFKAKLWHERAIHDSMNQVRERLLQEMGTVRNEARLSIALLDARMSALTL